MYGGVYSNRRGDKSSLYHLNSVLFSSSIFFPLFNVSLGLQTIYNKSD